MHRHGKDKLAALQNLFANSRVLRHSEYTFIAMISVKPMVWAIPSLAWPQSPSYKAANHYYFDYRGIKGFLKDPKSVIPDTKQPPFKGTDEQLEALVAYLMSLK